MEIQEVKLNIPLQYKAMQCRKENIEDLRDWIAKETLGMLQVINSVADGNYYLYNDKQNSCKLIVEGDWVILLSTSTSGVYPIYQIVEDELFRKMFVEPTANNEEREMCIADALQICDTGIPIRRKSWGTNEDGFNTFVMLLNVMWLHIFQKDLEQPYSLTGVAVKLQRRNNTCWLLLNLLMR